VGVDFEKCKERENKDVRIHASYKRTKKDNGGRYGLSTENARGTSSI